MPDDPDTVINYACITYKEGNFEDARKKFVDAINTLGCVMSPLGARLPGWGEGQDR